MHFGVWIGIAFVAVAVALQNKDIIHNWDHSLHYLWEFVCVCVSVCRSLALYPFVHDLPLARYIHFSLSLFQKIHGSALFSLKEIN